MTEIINRLTRDSRVRLYQVCNQAGVQGTPVDMSLSKLPDEAYAQASVMFFALATKSGLEEKSGPVSSCGYYVELGDNGADVRQMHTIFNGGPFTATPRVVVELERLLHKHATQADYGLK